MPRITLAISNDELPSVSAKHGGSEMWVRECFAFPFSQRDSCPHVPGLEMLHAVCCYDINCDEMLFVAVAKSPIFSVLFGLGSGLFGV